MTLITSFTAKGEEVVAKKSGKVAEEDILGKNELGQTVVLVPKGQPIPDDFDESEYAARTVPVRQADGEAEDEEPKSAKRSAAKKGAAAPENKGE